MFFLGKILSLDSKKSIFSLVFIFLYHFVSYANPRFKDFYSDLLMSKLKRSDLVVLGRYHGESYFLDSSGRVQTRLSFVVVRNYLERHSLAEGKAEANESIEVVIDGGIWQGVRYKSDPDIAFRKKKSYLLFLKKKSRGYFLIYGEGNILSYHKDVSGKIFLREESKKNVPPKLSVSDFEYAMNDYLHRFDDDLSFSKEESGQGEESDMQGEGGSMIYFLIIFLGVLGGRQFVRESKYVN